MFIFLVSAPVWCQAQIQNKIHYHHTRSIPRNQGSAVWASVFFRDYDLENDIKVRGLDDSLRADNLFKVEHTNPDVFFHNVTGIKINDSSLVTIYGTFYVRNYDLTPEERTKKMISRKGPDNVFRVARVLTDSSGRVYFKEWTSGWIEIPATQITSITVRNSNFWVNSQQEKDRLIRRIYNRVSLVYYAGGVAALTGLVFLLAAG